MGAKLLPARTFSAACFIVVASATAHAQTARPNFADAVYTTCREAHAMPAEARRSIALVLAEHAAQKRGVVLPDDERGAQLAYLVKGGCTLSPDAYLFAVIDRAIQADMGKLPKR